MKKRSPILRIPKRAEGPLIQVLALLSILSGAALPGDLTRIWELELYCLADEQETPR